MFERMRHRLDPGAEDGVTMIEVLVVVIILGILLAIAVPSWIGFQDRAASKTSKANLRAALPAAEAYREANGTYVGMDTSALVAANPDLSSSLTVASAKEAGFCLADTVNGRTWSVAGPSPSTSDFHRGGHCT
jgi:type IV pilus assembly protein PilA